MTFAEKVKYVRMNLYLSQVMLAKELGVSFATVNRWETGKCQPNFLAQKSFYEFCKNNKIKFEEEI